MIDLFPGIANKASKLGRGVSLLWNGISLEVVSDGIRQIGSKRSDGEEVFLFESARSAISFALVARGVGPYESVVVSSFTCDAVTYAVTEAGASIHYVDINDDLTMSQDDVEAALRAGAKTVIVQNTFGKLGLKLDFINKLKSDGVFVIIDNCLSMGSRIDGEFLSTFGDVAIESLEVSKTLTVGWGGRLIAHNQNLRKKYSYEYSKVKRVSFPSDLMRVMQVVLSLLIKKMDSNVGVIFWYFFYGTRLFRKSCQKNIGIKKSLRKMGVFTEALHNALMKKSEHLFAMTNYNCLLLHDILTGHGLYVPVKQSLNEYIVSPRVSIVVDEVDITSIKLAAGNFAVDVGEWFSECPPSYRLTDAKSICSKNSNIISKKIINFPCHWGLRKSDINMIDRFAAIISQIVRKNSVK